MFSTLAQLKYAQPGTEASVVMKLKSHLWSNEATCDSIPLSLYI